MPSSKSSPSFHLTPAARQKASARGQAAMKAIYYIDGQPCAAEEVMERTGLTKYQVIDAIRRERDNKRLPLTWERLEEIAKRRRGES